MVFTLLVLLAPRHGALARILAAQQQRPTRQQAWALVLLSLLVWYNDPLIAAQVYAPSSGPHLLRLHALAQALFIAALLLHWLELFALMSGGSARGGGECVFIHAVVLVFGACS
jgi:Wnt-binding factor required for Wnt secretion